MDTNTKAWSKSNRLPVVGKNIRDLGGAVVTHLHPICEVGSSNPGPYAGKLVVAHHWSAVYSTEP